MNESQPVKILKKLLWTYFLLLLFEGALRKWILPGLSNVLLLARDPLVVAIYMIAFSCRRFVINGYVIASVMLAFLAFIGGVLSENSNVVITLIGLRTYFLHLPLIFVIQATLDREDVFRMGKVLLWTALPMSVLLVAQFFSSPFSRVNVQVGGVYDYGLAGTMGRFRPTGTFSFVNGVAIFYPLTLSVLLSLLLLQRKLPFYLVVASLACIIVAVPFSISRTNMIMCAIVLAASALALMAIPKPPALVARGIVVCAIVAPIISSLGFFNEGLQTFGQRWQDSTGEGSGGFRGAIVDRFIDDLIPPSSYFVTTPILGYGVGRGTNMAQIYLSGQRQFALGEGEWPRLVLEMGPVISVCFIALRVAISGQLLAVGLGALRRGNPVPLLIGVQAAFLVFNSQWSQPTTLGFAVFMAGMTFSSVRNPSNVANVPRRPARRTYGRSWQPPPPGMRPGVAIPVPPEAPNPDGRILQPSP